MSHLILVRRSSQGVWVTYLGKDVHVKVMAADMDSARLSFEADKDVIIERDEIREKRLKEAKRSAERVVIKKG